MITAVTIALLLSLINNFFLLVKLDDLKCEKDVLANQRDLYLKIINDDREIRKLKSEHYD